MKEGMHMEKNPHSQRETHSAFILESRKAPSISVLPQNTGELVHFFPKELSLLKAH